MRSAAWTTGRLLVSAVILLAVVVQFVVVVTMADDAGQHLPTVSTNYFSYFTIQSNLAAAAVLAWAGIYRLPRRRRDAADPRGLTGLFVAVTAYLVITGAAYNLLLRASSIGPDTVLWANELMHVVSPLFLLADLLFGTGHRVPRWRTALAVLIFPTAWIGYTLLRAPLVTSPAGGAAYWYPYPFLDPYLHSGWMGVLLYALGIAIGILAVAVGAVAVLRRRGRTRPAAAVS